MKIIAAIAAIVLATISSAEENNVGVMLPLTGQTAYIGNACQNGIALALESLPAAVRQRLNVLYEDDQMQAKNAVSAFNKLTSTYSLYALISLSSGTAKAVAPLAESKRLPLIAIASDPEVVRDRTHVVTYWVTPEAEAARLFVELKKNGITKIARVNGLHAAFESFRRAFDQANNKQVEVLLDEEFQPEVMDFRTVISKIKARPEIQAIFVNLYFGQVGPFTRQARELGVTLPFFGIENFEDENEVKTSQGAMLGSWYIQADDGDTNFLATYAKRFPGKSLFFAANCHDSVLLIADSIKKNLNSEELNRFLHTVKDFHAALGTFSATGDNRFSIGAIVKKVTGHGFERVE